MILSPFLNNFSSDRLISWLFISWMLEISIICILSWFQFFHSSMTLFPSLHLLLIKPFYPYNRSFQNKCPQGSHAVFPYFSELEKGNILFVPWNVSLLFFFFCPCGNCTPLGEQVAYMGSSVVEEDQKLNHKEKGIWKVCYASAFLLCHCTILYITTQCRMCCFFLLDITVMQGLWHGAAQHRQPEYNNAVAFHFFFFF